MAMKTNLAMRIAMIMNIKLYKTCSLSLSPLLSSYADDRCVWRW